jgi:hypothetical protein
VSNGKRLGSYNNAQYEEYSAPAEAISRAHLDPSGEGPDDWYLLDGGVLQAEGGGRNLTVGRYDSGQLDWGWDQLQIVARVCKPNWRANLSVGVKSMPVVGDARVEEILAEGVFLGFGVLFFYCGAVFNYFMLVRALTPA